MRTAEQQRQITNVERAARERAPSADRIVGRWHGDAPYAEIWHGSRAVTWSPEWS